jgi:pimeloyl-ACP methyl ester carboxylesterase
MFVGHGGVIAFTPDWPAGKRGSNFLFRTADLFTAVGFLVAVLDAPSDHLAGGLFNFRSSAAHAEDIAAVIAALRREAPVPVWVVGTSYGTLSAANAAARLTSDGPDGVVLTSSVTLTQKVSAESLMTIDLDKITVPVLVVRHRDDACRVAPPSAAPQIIDRLVHARKRELLTFDGGKPPESGPCDPLAPHGYFGIEAQVVDAIAQWIKAAR